MTKSNNEWVPDAGQEFEYKPWNTEERWLWALALCPDDGGIVFKAANGDYGNTNLYTCRPIKIEAEKRRDELTGILWNDLDKFYEGTDCTTSYDTARYLISVGWVKYQPLTDDVIDSVMKHAKFSLTTYRDFAKAIEAYICGEG